jgi:cation transport ATPase
MGTGTDAAIEASDLSLVRGDPMIEAGANGVQLGIRGVE